MNDINFMTVHRLLALLTVRNLVNAYVNWATKDHLSSVFSDLDEFRFSSCSMGEGYVVEVEKRSRS